MEWRGGAGGSSIYNLVSTEVRICYSPVPSPRFKPIKSSLICSKQLISAAAAAAVVLIGGGASLQDTSNMTVIISDCQSAATLTGSD